MQFAGSDPQPEVRSPQQFSLSLCPQVRRKLEHLIDPTRQALLGWDATFGVDDAVERARPKRMDLAALRVDVAEIDHVDDERALRPREGAHDAGPRVIDSPRRREA